MNPGHFEAHSKDGASRIRERTKHALDLLYRVGRKTQDGGNKRGVNETRW